MMVADNQQPLGGATTKPPEGPHHHRPRSNSDPEVERTSSPHKKKQHPPVNKQSSASQLLITNLNANDDDTTNVMSSRKPLTEMDNDNRINVSTGNLPNNVCHHQNIRDGLPHRTMPTNHDRIGCALEKSTSCQSALCGGSSGNALRQNVSDEMSDERTRSKRASSDNSIPKCGLMMSSTGSVGRTLSSRVYGGVGNVENRTRGGSLYKKNDLGRPSVIAGSAGEYHVSYRSLQMPKKTPPINSDLANRRKSDPSNFGGMLSIEDEDQLPSSIVLDWDSYPSAHGALNSNGDDEPGVATIEVTNLGYKEPSVETITPRRPSSLNGSLNLNAGSHSALASPSANNANRTDLTPRTPEGTPAGTPVGPLPSFANTQDIDPSASGSHTGTPQHMGMLQSGGTSASSFASVSSLNTEYSTSNVSTTEDDSMCGEDGGFVEVNLYAGGGSSGGPGGERSAGKFDGQGAKPKKKGIAGFLAR